MRKLIRIQRKKITRTYSCGRKIFNDCDDLTLECLAETQKGSILDRRSDHESESIAPANVLLVNFWQQDEEFYGDRKFDDGEQKFFDDGKFDDGRQNFFDNGSSKINEYDVLHSGGEDGDQKISDDKIYDDGKDYDSGNERFYGGDGNFHIDGEFHGGNGNFYDGGDHNFMLMTEILRETATTIIMTVKQITFTITEDTTRTIIESSGILLWRRQN